MKRLKARIDWFVFMGRGVDVREDGANRHIVGGVFCDHVRQTSNIRSTHPDELHHHATNRTCSPTNHRTGPSQNDYSPSVTGKGFDQRSSVASVSSVNVFRKATMDARSFSERFSRTGRPFVSRRPTNNARLGWMSLL